MVFFVCPYLGGPVELTRERERHITERHSEVLPGRIDLVALALAEPDEIRLDPEYSATRKFIRRCDGLSVGKFLVVIVVSRNGRRDRHWIVTAFVSGRRPRGEVEWTSL